MQWANAFELKFLDRLAVAWGRFDLGEVPKFKREGIKMVTFCADERVESFNKKAAELMPVNVDYNKRLADDEELSLTDSSVVAYDSSGNDVSSSILSGSLALEDGVLQQDVTGGSTVDEMYKIVFSGKVGSASTDHKYQKTLHMVIDY